MTPNLHCFVARCAGLFIVCRMHDVVCFSGRFRLYCCTGAWLEIAISQSYRLAMIAYSADWRPWLRDGSLATGRGIASTHVVVSSLIQNVRAEHKNRPEEMSTATFHKKKKKPQIIKKPKHTRIFRARVIQLYMCSLCTVLRCSRWPRSRHGPPQTSMSVRSILTTAKMCIH